MNHNYEPAFYISLIYFHFMKNIYIEEQQNVSPCLEFNFLFVILKIDNRNVSLKKSQQVIAFKILQIFLVFCRIKLFFDKSHGDVSFQLRSNTSIIYNQIIRLGIPWKFSAPFQ